MFSKLSELTGLGLVAWGVALLLGSAAGIIFAGVSLVFVGMMTDDDAVGLTFRRGWGWIRYYWYRQVLREDGQPIPALRHTVAEGLLPCDCGGEEDCPVCQGMGYVPDPAYQEGRSPHPKLKIDPEVQERAVVMARQRRERSKLKDRTGALTQHDPESL